MSYPSFLWNKALRECAETEETIPGNVLTDLMLSGDMKDSTLAYFRKPCSAEEIPPRQGLFRLLLNGESFREHLRDLAEQLSEFYRITGFFDRAESQTERIMLFLPAIGRYLTLAESFAELER